VTLFRPADDIFLLLNDRFLAPGQIKEKGREKRAVEHLDYVCVRMACERIGAFDRLTPPLPPQQQQRIFASTVRLWNLQAASAVDLAASALHGGNQDNNCQQCTELITVQVGRVCECVSI